MDVLILRFGELWLKSEQVKKKFLSRLVSNIKKMLEANNIKFKIEQKRERLFVHTGDKKAIQVLQNAFGLVSLSSAVKTNLDDLEREVVKMAKASLILSKTFAVRVKRTGKHDFTSQEMERDLGALVVGKFGNKVNLTNPDVTVFVEVFNDDAYIFTEKVECLGGLPLGVEGKVVCLFSGGIDSAVAVYMMMKRGCDVTLLFVDNGFYDKTVLRKAGKVCKVLKKYDSELKLVVEKIKLPELAKNDRKYVCILCKREMYRTANKLARKLDAKAIATGECLGQVASQTLDNLRVLDEASQLPVLRPLVCFDKEEIIKIAKEIGTFEESVKQATECSAVPKYPETHAKLSDVLRVEDLYNKK